MYGLFSSLDVLTAENLRFEFLDLWLERCIPTKSRLIITQGIEAAIILAKHIIVLVDNLGCIRANLPSRLSHDHNSKSHEFQSLVEQIYNMINTPQLETAFFVGILLTLVQMGGGLQIGSITLMLLKTIWYILFNLIANVQSIHLDFLEVARVYKHHVSTSW